VIERRAVGRTTSSARKPVTGTLRMPASTSAVSRVSRVLPFSIFESVETERPDVAEMSCRVSPCFLR
jgi:hypothetical protein